MVQQSLKATGAKRQHAIVIGASVAGLMTARVLSDHFEKVTVVERDTLPDGADFRNGVPQARHAHGLLARGQNIMEKLFPGLTAELDEIGSPKLNWGKLRSMISTGWVQHFENGHETNLVSRVSLEWLFRKHVNQIPAVKLLTRCDVEGLLTDDARSKVTGMAIKSREDGSTQQIFGDLVVDTSGRNSKAPEWLQALGYSAPAETHVKSYVGYASRWYEATGTHDWTAITIGGNPKTPQLRSGSMFNIEGKQWLVTLSGMNKDYPPTDEATFLEFAKSIASPVIYDLIKDAKPITSIFGYRYDSNMRRHYERLTRRPENFILLGDAVTSLNPIYGQGMTVAAMEAEKLGEMLAAQPSGDLAGFATRFQKEVFKLTQDVWMLSTGEDLRFPGTEGDRPGFLIRLLQRYTEKVVEATTMDKTITRTFLQVLNLLEPPAALFTPSIIYRVLRCTVFGRETKPINTNPDPELQSV